MKNTRVACNLRLYDTHVSSLHYWFMHEINENVKFKVPSIEVSILISPIQMDEQSYFKPHVFISASLLMNKLW